MSFLLPAFLVGGALVGLPILLHFLRKKPTLTVPFPSLRFLGPSVLRESRKHRIRRWIVLALRCLAILLLALAFARPFFAPSRDLQGTAMVVAVDNSFSMQAGDRWETLGKWALEQTAGLGPEDQLGVLLMHPSPTWLVPLSDDVEGARAALRAAPPGWFGTRYAPALRLAGEVLANSPKRKRTLVWMADEQRLGWHKSDFETALPPGVELVTSTIRTAPEHQAAVSDVRITAQGTELVAEAKVTGYGTSATERTVALRVDGREVQRETVALDPLQSLSVRFQPVAGADAVHAFEVALDPDDLTADDRAFAAWEPNAGLPVVLPRIAIPANEADFLAHAIASSHPERGERLRAIPWESGDWPGEAVVVLRGERIFEGSALDEFLTAGGQAWMFHDGSKAQREWLERHGIGAPHSVPSASRRLAGVDLQHPVMEPFAGRSLVSLLDLRFDRGRGFDETSVIPIARWADGSVALGEARIGEGRLLLAGFDLSRGGGSLVIETAFVPLVHRAFTWLHQAGRGRPAVAVGDTVDLPGPGRELRRIFPDEASLSVEGAWMADRPGIYRYLDGDVVHEFAVNVNVEESDLAPWPSPEDLARLESDLPAPARAHSTALVLSNEKIEQQRQTWWWLLAMAGLILLSEMALANRTAL